MALEAIRDQPRAVELLRRALAGARVAHAYAFVGAPGSGRMTTALAFAEELLFGRVGAGNPLEQPTHAPTRVSGPRYNNTAVGTHPDLHVLAPTPPENKPKAARTIRIDAIRELERQALPFHRRVRRGYREIQRAEPKRVRVVDAAQAPAAVAAAVQAIVGEFLRGA